VAGPVIQATRRSEFEDGLGSRRVTLCRATHITWVSALGCLTIRSRPNSKSNGLTMLKHLFPLFEYRSEATSWQSVLGWVTALSDIPLQGKMLIEAVGHRCCITSWGIDPMHCTTHTIVLSWKAICMLWTHTPSNKQTRVKSMPSMPTAICNVKSTLSLDHRS
jgi:hypothetical protein